MPLCIKAALPVRSSVIGPVILPRSTVSMKGVLSFGIGVSAMLMGITTGELVD